MKIFLHTLFLVLILGQAASADPNRDWPPPDFRGIHYAVPRNALEPERWRDELQHTADCRPPCIVEFDDRMSAVHLRYKWMQLNPQKGVYDFSDLGAVLDIIHAAGKKATLIVMAGKYTPPWVIEAGAGHLDTTFQHVDRYSQDHMPLPWDPVFLAAHGDMIAALSDFLRRTPSRYDTVVLVKNGGMTTHSGETRLMPVDAFLPRKTAQDAQKADAFHTALCAEYARAGYSEKSVRDATRTMTAQIATAFPDQYLGLAFVTGSRRFPTTNAAGKCAYPEKNTTVNDLIKDMVTTYGARAIINNTTLAEGMGQPRILNWVRKNGGHIAFQLNAQKVGCRSEKAPCAEDALRRAVREGVDAGAVFIEIHDGNVERYKEILPKMNAALRQR